MKRRDFLASLAVAPTTLASEKEEKRETIQIAGEVYAASWCLGPGFYLRLSSAACDKSRQAVRTLRIFENDTRSRKATLAFHKDGLDVRFVEDTPTGGKEGD